MNHTNAKKGAPVVKAAVKPAAKPIVVNKPTKGPISAPPVNIQNIVVSADLHAVIDLYALSKEVKAVDYEPEQFPGAIFRVAEPKAVIILFKNGKMICTGTSTEANIRRVLEFASKVISKYVISVNPPETKMQKDAKKIADAKRPAEKRM